MKTDLGKKSKKDFEKFFFKLMNSAVWKMENSGKCEKT